MGGAPGGNGIGAAALGGMDKLGDGEPIAGGMLSCGNGGGVDRLRAAMPIGI